MDRDALGPYERGLLLLAEHSRAHDERAVRSAVSELERAVRAAPRDAAPVLALAFALDVAGRPADAVAHLRRARALDPADREAEVLLLTLLAETADESEAWSAIEAAAEAHGVDLPSLVRELEEADMPARPTTVVQNGFLSARNFLWSRVLDEVERIGDAADPGGAEHARARERSDCHRMAEELRAALSEERVPEALRHLTRWAYLGVGDDVCRRLLFEAEREGGLEVIRAAVEPHATEIHHWLDGFGDGPLSDEAAAFMYLLLALEESR